MPEANVLYAVTAAVVIGLVVWVVVALGTAKEAWARPLAERAPSREPLPPSSEEASSDEESTTGPDEAETAGEADASESAGSKTAR